MYDTMESQRVLRPRNVRIEYFPKLQYYTSTPMHERVNYRAGYGRRSKSVEQLLRHQTVPAAQRIRSKSVDEPRGLGAQRGKPTQFTNQPRKSARYFNRSQSIDQPRAGAQRVNRSKSTDAGRRDTFSYMAQANAMLTTQLVKSNEELDEKKKKIVLLCKQNEANQKLIAKIITDGQKKDKEIAQLRAIIDQNHLFEEDSPSKNSLSHGEQFDEYIDDDPIKRNSFNTSANTSSSSNMYGADTDVSRIVITEIDHQHDRATLDAELEHMNEEWLEQSDLDLSY